MTKMKERVITVAVFAMFAIIAGGICVLVIVGLSI